MERGGLSFDRAGRKENSVLIQDRQSPDEWACMAGVLGVGTDISLFFRLCNTYVIPESSYGSNNENEVR